MRRGGIQWVKLSQWLYLFLRIHIHPFLLQWIRSLGHWADEATTRGKKVIILGLKWKLSMSSTSSSVHEFSPREWHLLGQE